jgi:hypothetical protein
MTEEGKVVAKITTPVNDMVTANVKTVSFAETQSAQTSANTAVTEANFVIKAAGATVIAGLQTSQSPFMANNGDTRSHGVTALVPAGPVTVAAAYYTTTTAGGPGSLVKPAALENITALGVLGKFGAVNVNAWYASVEDSTDIDPTLNPNTDWTTAANAATVTALTGNDFVDASAMSISIGADLGAVKVDAMMTTLESGAAEGELTKVVVSGNAGNISYAAAYAMTGDGALGGQVTLDNDSDAISDLSMHVLNMQATTDSSAFYLMGKIKMDNGVCASLSHLSGSSDAHADFDETDVKVGYSLSKNFKASLIYGMGEFGADFAESRIEVKYTF